MTVGRRRRSLTGREDQPEVVERRLARARRGCLVALRHRLPVLGLRLHLRFVLLAERRILREARVHLRDVLVALFDPDDAAGHDDRRARARGRRAAAPRLLALAPDDHHECQQNPRIHRALRARDDITRTAAADAARGSPSTTPPREEAWTAVSTRATTTAPARAD